MELQRQAVKLVADNDWKVLGRVIPISVTESMPMLNIQLRHKAWAPEHFHVGFSEIPAELALEISVSIETPFNTKLVLPSFFREEQEAGIQYIQMVKLLTPPDSLAFVTTGGLTNLISFSSMSAFGHDAACAYCKKDSGIITIDEAIMDNLLLNMSEQDGGSDNARSH